MKNLFTPLASERGNATIESIPLLIIFVVLIAYTFGSFGVIHTGILHSIAARTYAFETFRHRTNLTYFRDEGGGGIPIENTFVEQNRVHAIVHETDNGLDSILATERPIIKGLPVSEAQGRDVNTHGTRLPSSVANGARNSTVDVSPAWIQVEYGICLNLQCGEK